MTLDADWQIAYKRQMELYQWLFRQNDFQVSSTGYFVYCNGKKDKERFNGRLEFDIKVLPYEGNTDWVEDTLTEACECLNADDIPEVCTDCDFCKYRQAARDIE